MDIFSKKIYASSPEAFGIDISDLSIKLMKLESSGKKIKVSSFGKKTIPSDIIQNGTLQDEKKFTQLVGEAVREMSGRGPRTRWAVVSLPSQETFLRVVQMPIMKDEDIKRSIKWSAEENIPLNLNEAYFDWEKIPTPEGKHIDHIDALVVAHPKKTIDAYVRAIEAAGVRVISIEIGVISAARAVVSDDLMKETVLIVDIGTLKTDVSIYASGAVRFTSSMDIAGHSFSQSIAEKLKIGYSEAEKLKVEFGFDKEAQEGKVFEALKPVADKFIGQIADYINFYEEHDFHDHTVEKNKITKILFCGGGATTKNFIELCARKLKTDVALANPWSRILAFPLKEIPEISYEKSLSYTTAIGLALRGIIYRS